MKSQLIGANAVGQVDRKYILLTTSNDATSTTTTSSSSNSSSGKVKGRRTQNEYGACLGHVVVADQHAVDERVKMESMAAPYYAMQMPPPSSGEGPSIQGGIERRDVQAGVDLRAGRDRRFEPGGSGEVGLRVLLAARLGEKGLFVLLVLLLLLRRYQRAAPSLRYLVLDVPPAGGRLCEFSRRCPQREALAACQSRFYGHQLSIGSWPRAPVAVLLNSATKCPLRSAQFCSRSSLVLTSPFNARTVG